MTVSSEDNLSQWLQSLVTAGENSAQERANALIEQPEMLDTLTAITELNPEHFDLLFNLPLRESTEALLRSSFSNDVIDKPRLIFLFSQSRFLENHFLRLFQQYESPQHSADKSRTLLRALAHFFATGQPIQFDYTGPTEHLPSVILTSHSAIFEMFEALYRLYHGQPELYLHQLGEILEATDSQA